MDLEDRPDILSITSSEEFDRWYWPVAEMQNLCRERGLPTSGLKAELRARLLGHLRGEITAPGTTPRKPKNWSKAVLTRDTIIDANVTFGCNLRNFLKQEIGPKFRCTGEFMDWVKSHPGRSLGEAIAQWHLFHTRAQQPGFRREIASCNNYLQYLRDLRDAHPNLTLTDAKLCWAVKSKKPAVNGFVVYEETDLSFLDPRPVGLGSLQKGNSN
ncbi:DUF6434 domain-containing protein [Phaeobacter sp.]|uniref:DUF6434 domain-containing protein n=1 Tax=Phaeobacter sp. TaxID=1902409 RepID=UPI0025CC4382|nr:DUF6434 domain-containing protein [Phaeobacter sp.]